MLKKIKKYKITLRPSYVFRNLKRKSPIETDQETVENAIDLEIDRLQKSLVPSSIYESFTRVQTPEKLQPLWQTAPNRALSLSVLITTIGDHLEKETDSFRQSDPFKAGLIEAIARESLDQSSNFVLKLLEEEAKSEGCELSPSLPLDNNLLQETLTLLESHKAEITLNSEGHLTPLFSAVSFCFWTATSKNKNAKHN